MSVVVSRFNYVFDLFHQIILVTKKSKHTFGNVSYSKIRFVAVFFTFPFFYNKKAYINTYNYLF